MDTGDCGIRAAWKLIALPDDELEKVDLVEMNLAVARGIPALSSINVQEYVCKVDAWTEQFARWLPGTEAGFHRSPSKWKNDIRFFRIGQLQGFLGYYLGIRYKDEQRNATAVAYTNPSDLFLNGLIDTMTGTCATMATLHVAMSRRMGEEPKQRNEGDLRTNLIAALKYLCRKGFGKSGQPARNRPSGFFDGWPTALERYGPPNQSKVYGPQILKRANNPSDYVPIETKSS